MTTTGTVRVHESLLPLLEDASVLSPHPRNARNGDVDAIVISMEKNGVYRPVFAQRSTGYVLAGNHTYAAMLALGFDKIPVLWLDYDDDEALRVLLADNKTAELGGYDEGLLLENLSALGELAGTGYSMDDLAELDATVQRLAAEALDGEPSEDDRAPTTGELLSIADVTVGEPKHEVKHGQTWQVGRHHLVIAKLLDEYPLWIDLLQGRLFVPYPEPFITCSTIAAENELLLVQPNRYLAGHLLDKHASVHGEDSVVLVKP